jgi:WD40 repeat protein
MDMPTSHDATRTSEQPEQGDAPPDRRVIHTGGGDYAEGDIDKRQGMFVGRDQHNYFLGDHFQKPIVDFVSLVEGFPLPPPNETYVEQDQTKKLISLLTDTKSKRPIRIVLHGCGGRGKTTLIAQIVNMQSIKDYFSGRIFWLEAENLRDETGRKIVDMLSRQARIVSNSGLPPCETSVEQRHPLSLLVVDNIWDKEEAELLSKINDNCVVVVTSRKNDIARVLNANSFEISNMTLSEATLFLKTEINHREIFIKEGEYHNELQELVRQSKCWPLLIKVVSRHVLDLITAKSSVDKALKRVLRYLDAGVKLDEKLIAVVKETLTALDRGTNYDAGFSYEHLYNKLSIFPRSAKITLITLKYVFDTNIEIIELMCLKMMNSSLINFNAQEDCIQIHDELWTWARKGISNDKIKIWNQELLSQARSSYQSWSELLLTNQYFLDHISYHLTESGNVEWAEEIFTDISSLAVIIKMNGSVVLRDNLERISRDFPSVSTMLKPLIGMIERDRLFLNRCRNHLVETLEAVIYSRIAGQEGFDELAQTWRNRIKKPCLTPIRPINVEQSELINTRNLGAIVRLCRISTDGKVIVAVTDSKIVVWDWEKGENPKDLFKLQSGLKSVVCHISDDGSTIVLLTSDGSIKLWERQDGKPLWHNINMSWIVSRAKLKWCALSGNGKVLALIGSGGTIRVYERNGLSWNNEPFKRSSIWATRNQILECALNRDGTNLIVTSNEKVVRAWDWQGNHWSSAVVFRDIPKNASEISAVSGPKNRIIYRIKQTSRHERVIVATYSNREWTKRTIHQSSYHSSGDIIGVDCMGEVILQRENNPNILALRNINSPLPDRKFYGHSRQITCCELNSQANLALSGSEDQTIRVWDLSQKGQTREINNSCLSTNKRFLAVSTRNGVELWDSMRCQLLSSIYTDREVVSVGDSGEYVITAGYQNEHIYWSRSTTGWIRKEVSFPLGQMSHVSDVNSLDICPDGSLIASVESDGILMIHQNFDKSKPIAEILLDDSLQQCYWISPERLVVHGFRGLYWLKFSHGS